MAIANAVDYGWFGYQTNAGVDFNIKTDKTWGGSSESGLFSYDASKPALVPSGRTRLRKVLLQDPVSGRTTQRPVNAGATSLTIGTLVYIAVRGAGGSIAMQSLGEVPERLPKTHIIISKPEPVTT